MFYVYKSEINKKRSKNLFLNATNVINTYKWNVCKWLLTTESMRRNEKLKKSIENAAETCRTVDNRVNFWNRRRLSAAIPQHIHLSEIPRILHTDVNTDTYWLKLTINQLWFGF